MPPAAQPKAISHARPARRSGAWRGRRAAAALAGAAALALAAAPARAEYRAYELEVFDRVEKKSEIVVTSFSPSDYIQLNGGTQRVGVVIRASWICWGDTSDFKPTCPMPDAVNARFEVGDEVEVILSKHITDGWKGKVENRFHRPDLRSNVYGVRFPDKGNLYTRYYEANLQKQKPQ